MISERFGGLAILTTRILNGDSIEDGEQVDNRLGYPYTEESIKDKDLDHDGLPNGAERYEVFTNYNTKSTDGDRYSDGMEYYGNQDGVDLPAYVKANPFSPSTPDIAISVDPNVKVILAQSVTVGSNTIERGEHSYDTETSQGFSANVGASTEVLAEAKICYPPTDSGASVTAKVSVHASIEATATSKNTKTSRKASLEEWVEAKSVDLSGSQLSTTVNIKNIGDDLLTSEIKELILNFYLGADEKPFATWVMSKDGTAPRIDNLKLDGEATFLIKIPIGFEEYSRFDSGEALTIAVDHYSFGDDQIWLINAQSRCAVIDVDYGNGTFNRELIPVNSKGTTTLYDAYNTFGNIALSDDGKSIKSIDGKEIITAGEPPYKYWSISFQGIEVLPDNVANTTLLPRDHVLLKYAVDTDGDGISDEDEKLLADKISLAEGGTFAISAKHSGKCLGVAAGSTDDGAGVIQWPCNGEENQMFKVEPIANDPGYYRITARHSGKCLGIAAGSTNDGAAVIQWSCNGQDNQMFKVEPIANDPGYYQITARHSGKCLGVSAGSMDNSAGLVQWPCNGQDNQKFRLAPTATIWDRLTPGAQIKIRLVSCKGDYLHRADDEKGVRAWNSFGIGNEWTLLVGENGKVMLRSWKGDYLHRADDEKGVGTWNSFGIGNEWTLVNLNNGKVMLRSWKGDYLHRADDEKGVGTWNTGIGNVWVVEIIS